MSDLCASFGVSLDEWQEVVLQAGMGERSDGSWATPQVAVSAPRQNGKALDVSTPVLTAGRGFVPLADLVVGDRVFHPGGRPVRVVAKSEVMLGRPCFRVTASDGRSVVADGGHLWLVRDKCRDVPAVVGGQRVRGFMSRVVSTRGMVEEGLSVAPGGGPRFVLPAVAPVVCSLRAGSRTLAVASIEPVESRPVQCIQVDSPDGLFLAGEGLVPTHNSVLVVARALAGVLLFGEQTIIVSAHQQDTAREVFTKIVDILEANPRLNARVDSYGRALNREFVRFKSGQVIRFKARSTGGGRGFSCDCLLLDEAQILSAAAWSAVLPTLSARPNPQVWLLGTPPTVNDDGEVFSRFRDIGLRGGNPRVAYLEWSAEPGMDLDDPGVWAAANPAYGSRVAHERIADERASMSDAQFAVERLGMWSGAETRAVIPGAVWGGLVDSGSVPVEGLALALDMAPDGELTTAAVVGRRGDGRWHAELVEQASGSAWVPGRVAGIVERHGVGVVVVDGASPALSLVEPLRDVGVEVTVAGARDMGQACAVLMQVVFGDGLRHLGQPQLAGAVDAARKRAIGSEGLWGWGRSVSGADISPVVAVTLALWGAMSSTAKVQKQKRSGRGVFRN